MKTTMLSRRSQILAFSIALLASGSGTAGEFVNFTFDEPEESRFQDRTAPIEDAFRGWSMQWGFLEPPTYFWPPGRVGVASGGAPIGLSGNSPSTHGRYYVTVHEYWQPTLSRLGDYRPTLHLSQTGLIPTNAWQLSSYMNRSPFATPAEAYIDDHLLGRLGGLLDVSAFAGREVKLEFVFPGGPSHYYEFDLYGFTPIPEPSTWALLATGLGGLAFRLRRCRRH